MDYKHLFLMAVFAVILPFSSFGQIVGEDTLCTKNNLDNHYEFKWKRTALPLSLIGVGAVALAPTFVRQGSRRFTHQVLDFRGSKRRLIFDDYLQYVPVAGSVLLGCTGIKARHSFRDRCFILATSYATLAVLTNVPKTLIDSKRPQFAGHNSFPSGHTGTTFMGAELMRIEYGGWYGVGAYIVAAGVGFMRIYNGRHWLHDVVAGAGVGILSARVGVWSCRLWQRVFRGRRKKEQPFVLMPVVSPIKQKYYGLAMGCHF